MTHLVLATYCFLAPFNAVLIVWFSRSERHDSLMETGAFVANCITQVLICFSLVSVCVGSALLYDCVKDRVRGSEDPTLPLRWRSTCINSITTTLQTGVILPFFFPIAAACEWIAAVKCA